jgi:hypothetical protein
MGKSNDDLFDTLRSRGVRKKLAKSMAKLDGNRMRSGAKGEKLAKQAAEDLTAAADDIRQRVLRRSRTRSAAARKAAQTRKSNARKRKAAAKKASRTRRRVSKARGGRGR